MPFIEGVGDEVFQVLMITLVVFLAVLGWWSTNIREQPLIRTVLILEPRRIARTVNTSNPIAPNPPEDTGQPVSTSSSEVHTASEAGPDASSGTPKNETQGSPEQQLSAASQADVGGSSSQNSEPEGTAASSTSCANSATSSVKAVPTDQQEQQLQLTNQTNIEPAGTTRESSNSVCDASSAVDVSSNEVRRRRLNFFGERGGTDNTSNEATTSSSHDNQETSTSEEEPAYIVGSNWENTTTQEDPLETISHQGIRIKLKFLNDNQKLVHGNLEDLLGDFKRRNFAGEIEAHKVIRLIFNGQVLQSDERTLESYGMFDGCVVHCLVQNPRNTNPNVENAASGNVGEDLHFGGADTGEPRDWDMSNVMYISMFVILSAIWYLRINFSQLFSATSTVALFGLSGIFVIFLVGMYIPDQEVLRT